MSSGFSWEGQWDMVAFYGWRIGKKLQSYCWSLCTWVRRWGRGAGVVRGKYHRGGWKSRGSDPESAACGTPRRRACKRE
jgi:hypothetical protein